MADVITLKDGSVETLLEPRDFQYLVEKHMGYDVETYFRTLIEKLQEEADYTKAKVETDLDSYEAQLEGNTTCFLDILDIIKGAEKLLMKKRLNKAELVKLLNQIKTEINNVI